MPPRDGLDPGFTLRVTGSRILAESGRVTGQCVRPVSERFSVSKEYHHLDQLISAVSVRFPVISVSGRDIYLLNCIVLVLGFLTGN